jgi:hypothetical protein
MLNDSETNDPIRFAGLQDGGHLSTGCRPIVMCELGLSPLWCPKPDKYTFVDKCGMCKLYLHSECMFPDRSRMRNIEDV